jgi:3-hydroxybutyrate dehydrogenase
MLNGFGERAMIDRLAASLTDEFGVRVGYHGADMSKPAEIADMIDACVRDLGSIDVLVNNAGIQYTAPIEEFPPEKWEAIIAINLSSSFYAIRAALPRMKARGWGRIVNIASTHALVASPTKAAYVASKHGVLGLTKVVALETAQTPITCNAICPGYVLTPLVQKQIDDLAARERLSQQDAKTEFLAEKHPSREFVTVEQIGAATVFLCSPAADQVRGTTIVVDGGWTAQ